MRAERKWFKRIVSMLMILAILIADIPLTTFQNEVTQAGEGNGTGGDHIAGKGTWGSSVKRTGWLIYLVEKNTGNVPEVIMNIEGNEKKVPAVSYVGYTLDNDKEQNYVYTRVGKHKPAKPFKSYGVNGAEWGAPFDNGQHGRGNQVREFFTKYDATKKEWTPQKNGIKSKTNKYAAKVDEFSGKKEDAWDNDLAAVDKYLGLDAREKYKSNEYYLCLEAVAIHKNYEKTRWIAFSAYGVAQMLRETRGGAQENFITFSANDCLQTGTCLDKNWPNLPKSVPTGWLNKIIKRDNIEAKVKAKTNSTVNTMGYGFGMAAFRSSAPPLQRTYDEESLTPSAAPKETTGKTTIVKVYVEEYEVDIPKALIDMTTDTKVTTSESTEIETPDEPISEDATVSKTPDRDGMAVEEVEKIDRDKDRDEGIVDDLMGELTDSIAGTGGMVYDPDDEATYGEVSIDETKEDMTDDVSESDSKFSGSIDESLAGDSDVYDTDDTDESEEDATAEVEGEDDDTFDPTTSTNIEVGADVDVDYVTVKAYRQVEKVQAGKGGCESTDANPGVAVTKKVGNEILILDESGNAKDVKGGT